MRYYPRLRDLREDHDLTQTQLVEQLGIHKTTYTNYEQGKREPPFEFMIQLAEFYQVSLDYLAGWTNDIHMQANALHFFFQIFAGFLIDPFGREFELAAVVHAQAFDPDAVAL